MRGLGINFRPELACFVNYVVFYIVVAPALEGAGSRNHMISAPQRVQRIAEASISSLRKPALWFRLSIGSWPYLFANIARIKFPCKFFETFFKKSLRRAGVRDFYGEGIQRYRGAAAPQKCLENGLKMAARWLGCKRWALDGLRERREVCPVATRQGCDYY